MVLTFKEMATHPTGFQPQINCPGKIVSSLGAESAGGDKAERTDMTQSRSPGWFQQSKQQSLGGLSQGSPDVL